MLCDWSTHHSIWKTELEIRRSFEIVAWNRSSDLKAFNMQAVSSSSGINKSLARFVENLKSRTRFLRADLRITEQELKKEFIFRV